MGPLTIPSDPHEVDPCRPVPQPDRAITDRAGPPGWWVRWPAALLFAALFVVLIVAALLTR